VVAAFLDVVDLSPTSLIVVNGCNVIVGRELGMPHSQLQESVERCAPGPFLVRKKAAEGASQDSTAATVNHNTSASFACCARRTNEIYSCKRKKCQLYEFSALCPLSLYEQVSPVDEATMGNRRAEGEHK
jgi:hypothetical protein